MPTAKRDPEWDLAFLRLYDKWIEEESDPSIKEKLHNAQISWARYFHIDLKTRSRVKRPYGGRRSNDN